MTASNGFAIDQIAIGRLPTTEQSSLGISQTNEEWHGYLRPGRSESFVIELEEGLHDFFVQVPKGNRVMLCVKQGLAAPTFTNCLSQGSGPDWSKVADRNVSRGYYTVVVRNPIIGTSAKSTPFTFMVNRISEYFNIDVEFDWTVPASEREQLKCRLETLLKYGTERLYGATDGYMRLGEVNYWMESCFRCVDMTVYQGDSGAVMSQGLQRDIAISEKHLRFFADGTHCSNSSGNKRDGAASFVHEFGHYEFGLGDEYKDGFCPWCIMDVNEVHDFCTDLNHIDTDAQDEPCWKTLDGYDHVRNRTKTPNPHVFQNSAIRNTMRIVYHKDC